MKPIKIETKKAYFVSAWTDKIIQGYAYETIIYDYGDTKGVMFTENGKVWRFIQSHNSDKVYFNIAEATKGANKQVKEAKEYYQKQIDEYTKKVKEYERTT